MDNPTEIKTSDLRPGDFLDVVNPASLRGPRGGKYRFAGVRVESRIVSVEATPRGLAIRPSTGPAFVLPGNLADLTTATVRRSDATDVRNLSDDDLLAALDSDDRAVRLAAQAEADRRTSASFDNLALGYARVRF